ncbi:hypothetical protein BDV27DRAFT_55984 [Aspergillus caelatus]|uniref:Uncharacterized protein n=1 Tax=Aspergillus caelatus TaxID=61420 RepID=A0A5N6ZNX9_9EURO|nr:uncharacterized protein BDV27DRAFT_55984 [Aspergillus caelatus]KAE8359317.1 hypothetical protein BDV27DRAFT_55984 [Aspergillus caelatus]
MRQYLFENDIISVELFLLLLNGRYMTFSYSCVYVYVFPLFFLCSILAFCKVKSRNLAVEGSGWVTIGSWVICVSCIIAYDICSLILYPRSIHGS